MNEIHYYSNYANSHDIDCFFRIGKIAYHFASNGHLLPSFITRRVNIAIQNIVYEKLQTINEAIDVEIHGDSIRRLISKNIEDVSNELFDERSSIDEILVDYAYSFKEMADLGFVSMDMGEEGIFYVIASPKNKTVPEKILQMLPEVSAESVRIEFE